MDDTELIERYLDDDMDSDERTAFEQRLALDEELARELALHRHIRTAVVLEEREAIRRQLKAMASAPDTASVNTVGSGVLQGSVPGSKPVDITNRVHRKDSGSASGYARLWISAAAGILILATIMLVFRDGAVPYDVLSDSYYRTFPNIVAPSVRGDAPDDYAGRAFLAYDNGDFERAEEYFARIENPSPELLFYRAMSLMELHRYAEAARLLIQLRDEPELVLSDRDLRIALHWYLALVKLKLNDRDAAVIELNRIAAEQHIHGAQARSLLEQL